MKYKCIGEQYYSFDNAQGQHIEGFKLHCVQSNPNKTNHKGDACVLVSIKPDAFESLLNSTTDRTCIGKSIDVEYNANGKPEMVTIVK